MQRGSVPGEAFVSQNNNHASPITLVVAVASLVWYVAVALVCTIGYVQLYVHPLNK